MSKNSFIEKEEERCTEILDSFGDEFAIAIEDRAKLCASNFLLQVGAKATLTADGYLAAAVQIATATIVKMVDDGFISLTGGLAHVDSIKERQAERAERKVRAIARADAASAGITAGPGAYL